MNLCRRLASISVLALLITAFPSRTRAQTGESPIRVFGYFQNSFEQQIATGLNESENTFVLQQLNLFFQKDIGKRLTSFVDFEAVNSFSASRERGGLDLEEAWVRWKATRTTNLKFGLQIPIFNNLNEINNRTPLLPYVIRPIVYETAFQEFINVDAFVPQTAFAQVYGFKPVGRTKLDYALYLGNGPNINSRKDNELFDSDQRTGVDTTTTIMIGGRVGLRRGDLKAGVSGTLERVNDFVELAEIFEAEPDDFRNITGVRFGADFSYEYKNYSLQSEMILVRFDDPSSQLNLKRSFFYGTLGRRFRDRLFMYATFWSTDERATILDQSEKIDLKIPSVGVAFYYNDNVTVKGQYAYVKIKAARDGEKPTSTINFITIAVSVVL